MMLGLQLGLRTVLGHRRSSLLAIAMLATVLAPILVLWGLKSGTLTALVDELRNDPRNLEIRLIGDNLLGGEELSRIAGLKGVGFLQPATRALAARAYLSREDGSGREAVSLLPSGQGDPMLKRTDLATPKLGEAILSAKAAAALGLRIGDRALLITQRENASRRYKETLTVRGVLGETVIGNAQVLLAPRTVEDVEAFLDGYEVQRLSLPGRPASERRLVYSNARLYADRIEAVPSLAAGVEALGYGVLSRGADIERLLALNLRLDNLVAALAAILLLGYCAAAGANIMAVFDRQVRNIALLRLMGAGRSTIVLFVLGFGLTTGVAGLFGALGLFGAVCAGINRWLPLDLGPDQPSCRLVAPQLLVATGVTLVLVLCLTLVAARRFAAISPAGALRAE